MRSAQRHMDIWLQPPAGPDDPPSPLLQAVLEDAWVAAHPLGEPCPTVLRTALAGEGNMNLSLRIQTAVAPAGAAAPQAEGDKGGGDTESGSWVLKQSRPWVQAYPEYAAPVERVGVEAAWYAVANGIPSIQHMVPSLAGVSRRFAAILCQDLGKASDFTPLYDVEGTASQERGALLAQLPHTARFLGGLHSGTRGATKAFTRNTEMRQLNATHMYDIPFSTTNPMLAALDSCEEGLRQAALDTVRCAAATAAAAQLQARYLADTPAAQQPVLLHGDFFFGSWLLTPQGVFVIDAEFAHVGDAEFDVGVALAHMAIAQVPLSVVQRWLHEYRTAAAQLDANAAESLRAPLLAKYAAVEVIRRLVGVGQIPQLRLAPGGRAGLVRRALLCIDACSAPSGSVSPVQTSDEGQQWQVLWGGASSP